ncbi:MAG: hypothetical protein IIB40_04380 [Candidatus Marinimicrobia bacterium]|nr:hypothetical protein [Candidatus Neomarinimicrobiota bacterium]
MKSVQITQIGMPFEHGAIIMCSSATSYHAFMKVVTAAQSKLSVAEYQVFIGI